MHIYSLQVLLQCPNLERLDISGCTHLQSLMVWSDKLTELDLLDSKVTYRRRALTCSLIHVACIRSAIASHACICYTREGTSQQTLIAL